MIAKQVRFDSDPDLGEANIHRIVLESMNLSLYRPLQQARFPISSNTLPHQSWKTLTLPVSITDQWVRTLDVDTSSTKLR